MKVYIEKGSDNWEAGEWRPNKDNDYTIIVPGTIVRARVFKSKDATEKTPVNLRIKKISSDEKSFTAIIAE